MACQADLRCMNFSTSGTQSSELIAIRASIRHSIGETEMPQIITMRGRIHANASRRGWVDDDYSPGVLVEFSQWLSTSTSNLQSADTRVAFPCGRCFFVRRLSDRHKILRCRFLRVGGKRGENEPGIHRERWCRTLRQSAIRARLHRPAVGAQRVWFVVISPSTDASMRVSIALRGRSVSRFCYAPRASHWTADAAWMRPGADTGRAGRETSLGD
ncbi:hypothetical protein B0T16DRAFT_418730 [Cercophora newfieldiana]|uniref:Uncharacterized protein n=1 Tax=Cercophora newfieldiana TaxID=92897 RepID=A0AA39XXM2_9PEZI|nr:hypothetical protein B0T16DRAFT_418730 [Cercophora newfieldiana]